jgi:hypothetical protein
MNGPQKGSGKGGSFPLDDEYEMDLRWEGGITGWYWMNRLKASAEPLTKQEEVKRESVED